MSSDISMLLRSQTQMLSPSRRGNWEIERVDGRIVCLLDALAQDFLVLSAFLLVNPKHRNNVKYDVMTGQHA